MKEVEFELSNVYFKLYWIICTAEGRENECFSMEDDNFRFWHIILGKG